MNVWIIQIFLGNKWHRNNINIVLSQHWSVGREVTHANAFSTPLTTATAMRESSDASLSHVQRKAHPQRCCISVFTSKPRSKQWSLQGWQTLAPVSQLPTTFERGSAHLTNSYQSIQKSGTHMATSMPSRTTLTIGIGIVKILKLN